MPAAPKLARRTVPEGGFDSNSRIKNGAANAPLPALRKNDRRSVIMAILLYVRSGPFYGNANATSSDGNPAAPTATTMNCRPSTI